MGQSKPSSVEAVFLAIQQLSPGDRLRLIEKMLPELASAVEGTAPKPLKNCCGLLSDLGPGPSEEDIAKMRSEMFRDFR